MGSDAVVVIQQLTKKYGELTALHQLSLSLERGQILGFIGPNGAGKTTTIKILVGQARPTSGTATIAGVDCTRESPKVKRLVGYMPDTFGSYDAMRVREYLDFFGAAFAIPRKLRIKRIDEVMEIAGATALKDRFVDSLSHGMKQRVAIARTLLHDPPVLILDEPANGLDPQARIDMRLILLRLAEMGKTLIVTSHILPELSRICDHIAIMTHGQLRAFGTLDEIMRKVRQLRTMEIQLVSADQIDNIAQLVRQLIGPDAQIETSPAEAVVRFTTKRSDQDMAGILAQLIERRVCVSQFRELQADLEETFLSITQEDQSRSPATLQPAHASGVVRK